MQADDETRHSEPNRGVRQARTQARDDSIESKEHPPSGQADETARQQRGGQRPPRHDFWEEDPEPGGNRGPGYTGGGGPSTGPEFREYEFHGLGAHWHDHRRHHHYWNIFDAEERRRRRASSAKTSEPHRPGFHGTPPKGYTRSDERIFEDVCESLQAADLDPSDVTVEVASGEVTLSGSVTSRWAKRYAEDLAYSVRGVVDVHNRLRAHRHRTHR